MVSQPRCEKCGNVLQHVPKPRPTALYSGVCVRCHHPFEIPDIDGACPRCGQLMRFEQWQGEIREG